MIRNTVIRIAYQCDKILPTVNISYGLYNVIFLHFKGRKTLRVSEIQTPVATDPTFQLCNPINSARRTKCVACFNHRQRTYVQ